MAPEMPPRLIRHTKKPFEAQVSLFGGVEASGGEEAHAEWIGRLFTSPVFVAQRRMAGRRAPNDRAVETFLKALDQRHNRISRRALAQALGQPDVRMHGILVGLQRLLNVDGYQIVAVDKDAGTIEINRQLLDKQFQLW
jgi:hypothetical protein